MSENVEDEAVFQPYAKLFISEDYGQILVTYDLDSEEDERSIDMRFQVPGGETKVITQAYTMNEAEYSIAYKLFNEIDEDTAIEMLNDYMEVFGKLIED